MKLQAKTGKWSVKMKTAVAISVLWFGFWLLAGFTEESLLGGLAFGGIPLIIIWGFWMMVAQDRKEMALIDQLKDQLADGAPGKREFVRLEYPPGNRPVLKLKESQLEIIDISEKGLKLSNQDQLPLGRLIHGEAELLSGRIVPVDGEVAWSLNNEVGLLMALLPSSIIAEERRVVSASKSKAKKQPKS